VRLLSATESVALPPYRESAHAEKHAPANLQNVWQAYEMAASKTVANFVPSIVTVQIH